MTDETQVQQAQPSDKELNFRAQERSFKAKIEEIESEKRKLELRIEELSSQKQSADDDDDDEPYVDKKRLNRTLQNHSKMTQTEIQKAMDHVSQKAKEELRQEMWLEQNPDFYDTMQKHAERFAQKAPKLAESILKMPDGFERQKLVYQNIKALGVDQPEARPSSIQEKIDANKRSPYYQPSGVASPAYSQTGDFSPSGQKAAYEKLQELKKTLRI